MVGLNLSSMANNKAQIMQSPAFGSAKHVNPERLFELRALKDGARKQELCDNKVGNFFQQHFKAIAEISKRNPNASVDEMCDEIASNPKLQGLLNLDFLV